MNKHPLIAGGLLAIVLIAGLGTVYATTAQTNSNSQTTAPSIPSNQSGFHGRCGRFNGTAPDMPRGPMMAGFYGMNLTASQRAQLNKTMQTLRAQNATPQEMRAAMFQQLEAFGVLDAQLNASLSSTQRRLTILNREKELRSQGYNWTTIESMIAQEYGQNATQDYGNDFGMMNGPGPHGGRPQCGMMNRPDQ